MFEENRKRWRNEDADLDLFWERSHAKKKKPYLGRTPSEQAVAINQAEQGNAVSPTNLPSGYVAPDGTVGTGSVAPSSPFSSSGSGSSSFVGPPAPTPQQRLNALRKKSGKSPAATTQSKIRNISVASSFPDIDVGKEIGQLKKGMKDSGTVRSELRKQTSKELNKTFDSYVKGTTDARHAGLIQKAFPNQKSKDRLVGAIALEDFRQAAEQDMPAAQNSPWAKMPDPNVLANRVEVTKQRANKAFKRFDGMVTQQDGQYIVKPGVNVNEANKALERAQQTETRAKRASRAQDRAVDRTGKLARRMVGSGREIMTTAEQGKQDAEQAGFVAQAESMVINAGKWVKESAKDAKNIPENVTDTGSLTAGIAKTFAETVKENPQQAAAALQLSSTLLGGAGLAGLGTKVTGAAIKGGAAGAGVKGAAGAAAKEIGETTGGKLVAGLKASPKVQAANRVVAGGIVGGVVADISLGQATDNKIGGYVIPAAVGTQKAIYTRPVDTAKTTARNLLSSVAFPFTLAGNTAATIERATGALDADATEYEKSGDYITNPLARMGEEAITEARNMVEVYGSKDADKIAEATAEDYGVLPALSAYWLTRPFTKGATRAISKSARESEKIDALTGGALGRAYTAKQDRTARNRAMKIAAMGLSEAEQIQALLKPVKKNMERIQTAPGVDRLQSVIDKEHADRTQGMPKVAAAKVPKVEIIDLAIFLESGRKAGTTLDDLRKEQDSTTNLDAANQRKFDILLDPAMRDLLDPSRPVGARFMEMRQSVRKANERLVVARNELLEKQGRPEQIIEDQNIAREEALRAREKVDGTPAAERPSTTIIPEREREQAKLDGFKDSVQRRRKTLGRIAKKAKEANRNLTEKERAETQRLRDANKADKTDMKAIEADSRAAAKVREAATIQTQIDKIDQERRGETADGAEPVVSDLDTRRAELDAEEARITAELKTITDPYSPRVDQLNEELFKIGKRRRTLHSLEQVDLDAARPKAPDSATKRELRAKRKKLVEARNKKEEVAITERAVARERRSAAMNLRRKQDPNLEKTRKRVAELEKMKTRASEVLVNAIQSTLQYADQIGDGLTKAEYQAIVARIDEELGNTANTGPTKVKARESAIDSRVQNLREIDRQLDELGKPSPPKRDQAAPGQLPKIDTSPEAKASTKAMDENLAWIKSDENSWADKPNESFPMLQDTKRRIANIAESMGINIRDANGAMRSNAELRQAMIDTFDASKGKSSTGKPRSRRVVEEERDRLETERKAIQTEISAMRRQLRVDRAENVTGLRSAKIAAAVQTAKAEKRAKREQETLDSLQAVFDEAWEQARELDYQAAIYVAQQRATEGGVASGSPRFESKWGTPKERRRTGELSREGDVDLSWRAFADTVEDLGAAASATRVSQGLLANWSHVIPDERSGVGDKAVLTEREILLEGEKGHVDLSRMVALDTRFLTDPGKLGTALKDMQGNDFGTFPAKLEQAANTFDAEDRQIAGLTDEQQKAQANANAGEGRTYYLLDREPLEMLAKLERKLDLASKVLFTINKINSRLVLGLSPSWAMAQPIAEMLILVSDNPNPARLIKAYQRVRDIHNGPDSAAKRGLGMLSGSSMGVSRTQRNMAQFHADSYEATKIVRETAAGRLMWEAARLETLGRFDRWKGAWIREMGVMAELDRELSTFRRASKAIMGQMDEIEKVSGILRKMDPAEQIKWLNSKEGMAAGERLSRNIDASLGNWTDLRPGAEQLIGSVIFFYPFVRFSINWSLRTFPKRHPGRWTAATMYGAYQAETLERLMNYDPQWMTDWAVAPIYGAKDGPPTSFMPLNRYSVAGNAFSEGAFTEGNLGFNLMKGFVPLLTIPARVAGFEQDQYGNDLADPDDEYGNPTPSWRTKIGQAGDEILKMIAPVRETMRISEFSLRDNLEDGWKAPWDFEAPGAAPWDLDAGNRQLKAGDDPNVIRDLFRRNILAGFPKPSNLYNQEQNVAKMYDRREEIQKEVNKPYPEVNFRGEKMKLNKAGKILIDERKRYGPDGEDAGLPAPPRNAAERKIAKDYIQTIGERDEAKKLLKQVEVGLVEYHKSIGRSMGDDSTIQASVEEDRKKAAKDIRKRYDTEFPGIPFPGYAKAQKELGPEDSDIANDGIGRSGLSASPSSGGYNYDAIQPDYESRTPLVTRKDQTEDTPQSERIPIGSGIIPKKNVPRKRQINLATRILKAKSEAFSANGTPAKVPQEYKQSIARWGAWLDRRPGMKSPNNNMVDGLIPANMSGAEYLAKIIQHESGWNHDAYNDRVGATGMGQFIPGTRQGMIDQYGVDPWASGEDAIHAAALYLSEGNGGLFNYNGAYPNSSDNQGTPGTWDGYLGEDVGKLVGGKPSSAKIAKWKRLVERGKAMGVYEVPEGRNLMPVELVSAPGMSPDIEGVNRPVVKLAKHLARVVKEPEFSITSGLRAPSYGSHHEYGNALDIEAYSLNNEAGTKESEARGNKIAYEAVRVLGGKAAADKYRADGYNGWFGPKGEEVIWGYDDDSTGGNHTHHVHIAVPDGAPMPNVPSKPMSPMQQVKAARRAAQAGNSALGTTGGGTTGGTTSSTTESPGTQSNAINNLQNFRNPDGSILNWGTGTEMDLPSAAVSVSEANQNSESDKVKSVAESFAGLPKYVKPKPKKR